MEVSRSPLPVEVRECSASPIASPPMRTIPAPVAALSIGAAVVLTLTGISLARSASADANARACVAMGANAAQCWDNARASF